MNFDQLRDFIERQMEMQHIYQPVMLMALLRGHGRASMRHIATEILSHDESQIEYYQKITRDMVGRVLRRRGVVQKDGKDFELLDFNSLSAAQVDDLLNLLQEKLLIFQEERGNEIWQHRRLSAGYIPGTIRFEVLKRAKFHCVLCGISADEKALAVDHIVPRNKGGSDEASNFQALCYSCNATKRDRDSTDFQKVVESFEHREKGCVFCELAPERVIRENVLCVAVEDKYPVAKGHVLVIPKRHTPDYFDLGQAELHAVNLLLNEMKQRSHDDLSVQGFNVGVNCGDVAGQTVSHCHVHLIPRRAGDVGNPQGGVRNVIPSMGPYAE